MIPTAVPPDVSTAPVIANVIIERATVFDPKVKGEDNWIFQTADKLHYVTREKIVRDELLFAPGQRWDALAVIQSERNMRSGYPYRRAEITPVPRPDGRVDALVRTQDAWSTNPRIGIGTSGGSSSASFGLEENNLFGYGKSVSYEHSEGSSVSGYQRANSYAYGDPRFLGTRLALNWSYSTRERRGAAESVGLTRPFYALDTERALTASWNNANSIGTEVRDGADYSKYAVRQRIVNAEYGLRLNNDRYFVQRVEAGWYANRAVYGQTSQSPATVPGTQPSDLNMSGPTIGYTWIQPHYVKETYIERMERVEDFNLGNELRVRTGYMARGTGSDEDRWIFNAADQQGLGLGEGRFALAGAGFSGRLYNNKLENGLATGNLNFFWKNYLWTRTRTLVAHLEAAQGHKLDLENQVILGGSNGLRGYKNDAFRRRALDPDELGGPLLLRRRVLPPGPVRRRGLRRVGHGRARGQRLLAGAVPERRRRGPARRLDPLDERRPRALRRGVRAERRPRRRSRWVVSLRGGQAFSFFNSASGSVVTSPPPGL